MKKTWLMVRMTRSRSLASTFFCTSQLNKDLFQPCCYRVFKTNSLPGFQVDCLSWTTKEQ